jgi:Uma2 family endonuclease
VILRNRPIAESLPGADDVLLVIEVADSSAGYDRSTKGRRYANAGIPEYWIVDLAADRVDVFREPRSGGYGVVRPARRGEAVAPANIPGTELSVDDILG